MKITKEYLAGLTHEQKDDIILRQADEIESLKAQFAALLNVVEDLKKQIADLTSGKTKKTSKNSSIAPSRDQKANKPDDNKDKDDEKQKRKKRSGPGLTRDLHPNPHEVKDVFPDNCPCGQEFTNDNADVYHEFDHIEIPKIEVKITRYRLHSGKCSCCGQKSRAQAPGGINPSIPYGPRLSGLLVHQRYMNYISYERLQLFSSEILNLQISQGALVNLMKRSSKLFLQKTDEIKQSIRESDIVESDETGTRINAKKAWEWIFQNGKVCLHVIRDNRSAKVPQEVLGGHKPTYWGSDLYSAQKGHGEKWQICLAHQLRDCQYAIDGGDIRFSWDVMALFKRAIKLGKRRGEMDQQCMKAVKRRVLQELNYLLKKVGPMTKEGRNLKRRYTEHRDSLFTFFDDVRVNPTNNLSEQGLRPSVIFRKVTNGYRSGWGADLYAAIRSVIGTGKRQGLTAHQSIQNVLIPA